MAKTVKKKLIIKKSSNIAEMIAKYPKIGEILAEDYGLHCVGCMSAQFDSFEQGMELHGYSDKDIEKIIIKLNKLI